MEEIRVTGTMIWYYYICKREVWLLAHGIEANQDNPFIDIGRFLQENTYRREKKEISLGNIKIDIIKRKDGQVIIGEVKKSSKFKESARMQLAYYLYELEEKGIKASGYLMFPKERRREEIVLTDSLKRELDVVSEDIIRIINSDKPEPVQKKTYCTNCAYNEFCWA
ncbi:MAG: CRISPR-associated protein Cas4 [Tissierellia bacterium]|nr:CRISPR-associated protein Cas4 [Tissierellia bacterium]